MSKILPRNGLVLVKFLEEPPERKTTAGIIIPKSNSAGSHIFDRAEVLEVGRGIFDAGVHAHTDDLKPGMIVLVKSGQRGGSIGQIANNFVEMSLDGAEVGLLNQADIFCILEETKVPALVTN